MTTITHLFRPSEMNRIDLRNVIVFTDPPEVALELYRAKYGREAERAWTYSGKGKWRLVFMEKPPK
jgi:hypothetical protein